MQLIRDLSQWPQTGQCVATIGNFDGVHLGHQHMFRQTRQAAENLGLPACVISFEPLPHEYFAPQQVSGRLHGLRDRVLCTSACGLDRLLLLRFDAELAEQSAEQFIINTLSRALHVKHLIVGDDFRFGCGRTGDFDLLDSLGIQHGFTVERSTTVQSDGKRVSSTRIRQYLRDGELAMATRLLGRPYQISGRIIHGEKMGRQLGFPTANVALHNHKPPLRGVFAVVARDLDSDMRYTAVANLGERPTIGGRKLLLEVHLIDRQIDLYGKHLSVEFLHFLRKEQKFDSLDALKAAISADTDKARRILSGNPELFT